MSRMIVSNTDDLEKFKVKNDFDKRIYYLLFCNNNKYHDPSFSETMIQSIKDSVNPRLIEFLASGAERIPMSAYDGKYIRVRRHFNRISELRVFLDEFLSLYFDEFYGGADKKRVRAATTQAVRTVIEVVRRNRKLACAS